MNIELKEYLEGFKECSLNIVDIVEKEAYEQLEGKIAERQEIIDLISKLSFTKEEITKIAKELEIVALSEKISTMILNKKIILKNQIDQNTINKNVNINYNKNFYKNFHIFSKKI